MVDFPGASYDPLHVTEKPTNQVLEWAELGRAIEAARGRQDLTQQELAELVGVSVKTINTLENGRANGMRAQTRTKLESALGWKPDHVHRLLTGQVVAATPYNDRDDLQRFTRFSGLKQPEETVGPPGEDDRDEIVFRLRVRPNATQQQRDMAKRAAEASARAVLAELDEE